MAPYKRRTYPRSEPVMVSNLSVASKKKRTYLRSGPVMIPNPFVAPRDPNELRRDQTQTGRVDNIIKDSNATNAPPPLVAGGTQEEINAGLAQSLLRSKTYEGDRHKKYLQDIVYTNSPTERERVQKQMDYKWRKIADAAMDPSNPYSDKELKSAYDQLEQESYGSLISNPMSVFQKLAEAETPEVATVNTAKAWSEQFGVPVEEITSLLGIKEGKFDTKQALEVYKVLQKQAEVKVKAEQDKAVGSTVNRNAVGKWMTSLEKSLKQMRQNVKYVDDEGELRSRPAPFFGNPSNATLRAQSNYDQFAAEYSKTLEAYATAQDMVSSFVTREPGDPIEQNTPQVGDPLGVPGESLFPRNKPYIAKPTDDFMVVYQDLQEQANRDQVTVWAKDVDGKMYPIEPSN